MRAVYDFFKSLKSGPTKPGWWRYDEEYGRFEGTGEVSVQVELPGGPTEVGIEDFLEVENLEFELIGPSGQPVEMKRWTSADVDATAVHQFGLIATGEIRDPGLHHLRVRAPREGQPLLVLVGEKLTVRDAISHMAAGMIKRIPGRKRWYRLRGE